MTESRHTAIPQEDIDRQIRWENRAVELGVQKLHDSIQEEGLGNSAVGKTMSRRLAEYMVHDVRAAQKEARKFLEEKTPGGSVAEWITLILTVKPEKLAVITGNAVMTSETRDGSMGIPISSLGYAIGAAVMDQMDFDEWEAEQKQLKKDDPEVETELDAFLKQTKQVNRKRFYKFSNKVGRVRTEKWSRPACINLGVKLIDILVAACPDHFDVRLVRVLGTAKTEYRLTLLPKCRDEMTDLINKAELASPRYMPMLVPPRPWREVLTKRRAEQ